MEFRHSIVSLPGGVHKGFIPLLEFFQLQFCVCIGFGNTDAGNATFYLAVDDGIGGSAIRKGLFHGLSQLYSDNHQNWYTGKDNQGQVNIDSGKIGKG